MATIKREILVSVEADAAWAALRDFGAAADLFAGVLVASRRVGDVRQVTFASGLEIREQLITVDDDARRLAYTVLDGSFSHHSASMQIVPETAGARFVWISDVLPDEAADRVLPLVEAGCAALKRNLETARS